MRFHFDHDSRDAIAGWVAPDNPSHVPQLRVEVDAQEFRVLEANVWRPDLVEARLHDTGLVGFYIDESIIPGFRDAWDVGIYETKTNKLIYRRTEGRVTVQARFFLFNNLPILNRQLRNTLAELFTLSYPMIESSGVETAMSLLSNNAILSVAGEGRFVMAPNMGFFRNFHFHLSALLVEPFLELANRLLFVRAVASAADAPPLAVLPLHFSNLGGVAARLPDFQPSTLAAAFSVLSEAELSVIRDPLVQMLGCAPGEIPEPRHVSIALSLLSEFHSVGTISRLDAFAEAVRSQLPELQFPQLEMLQMPDCEVVAARLREEPVLRRLLRNDVRLYRYVEESVTQALDQPADDEPSVAALARAVRRS
jgi:hypothetical protein